MNIQIDSINELCEIVHLIKQLNLDSQPKLSLRLSTDYHDMGFSRFGFITETYKEALSLLKNHGLKLQGLHFHVGSNLNDLSPYFQAIKTYATIIREQIRMTDAHFRLDIGGGFPAKSVSKDANLIPMDMYAKKIKDFLFCQNIPVDSIYLVLEPGRHFVEDHGYLVTKVMVVKKRKDKVFLIVDGGINLVSSLRAWYHPIEIIRTPSEKGQSTQNNLIYTIYGSNCFESDIFCHSLETMSPVNPGDLIVVGSAGGYDLPSANVWVRPHPAIYGIYKKKCILLRHQQSAESIRHYHTDLEV